MIRRAFTYALLVNALHFILWALVLLPLLRAGGVL